MIEPIMYFGLGFLAATLLALIIMPFVHGRAERLTTRRLEAAIPVSMESATRSAAMRSAKGR